MKVLRDGRGLIKGSSCPTPSPLLSSQTNKERDIMGKQEQTGKTIFVDDVLKKIDECYNYSEEEVTVAETLDHLKRKILGIHK